jgi:hypothetical protein
MQFDLSGMKPIRFEFAPKETRINDTHLQNPRNHIPKILRALNPKPQYPRPGTVFLSFIPADPTC